jgi:hypothetical protein
MSSRPSGAVWRNGVIAIHQLMSFWGWFPIPDSVLQPPARAGAKNLREGGGGREGNPHLQALKDSQTDDNREYYPSRCFNPFWFAWSSREWSGFCNVPRAHHKRCCLALTLTGSILTLKYIRDSAFPCLLWSYLTLPDSRVCPPRRLNGACSGWSIVFASPLGGSWIEANSDGGWNNKFCMAIYGSHIHCLGWTQLL